MTTRPIDPFVDDIHRYERSWTLVTGSRRWSFTKVDYRSSCTALQVIDHRAAPQRRSITTMLGIMLALIAGATTLGLAVNSDRAAAGNRYTLSIAVPEKPRTAVVKAKAIRKPAVVPVTAVAASPVPSADAVADDTAVSVIDDDPAPDQSVTRLLAMQPAVSAAMRTGQMQQWAKSDGSERGFVVAGPSAGGCRTLSVLIKRGGDNEVKSLRECGATGKAVPAAASAGDQAMTAGDVSIDQ
ncbi:hypothetical protein [Sphingomonas mollis]|nr:hypothetical protein [Sphingomonas sp. BT553]